MSSVERAVVRELLNTLRILSGSGADVLDALALAAAARIQAALMLLELADHLDELARIHGPEAVGVRIYSIALSANTLWSGIIHYLLGEAEWAAKLAWTAYKVASERWLPLPPRLRRRLAEWLFSTATAAEERLTIISRRPSGELGAALLPTDTKNAVRQRQFAILRSPLPLPEKLHLAVEEGAEMIAPVLATSDDPFTKLLQQRVRERAKDAESLREWLYELALRLADPDIPPLPPWKRREKNIFQRSNS